MSPTLIHAQPSSEDTFVTTDESTLMHDNTQSPYFYVRVHCWCYMFLGFGKMCNDVSNIIVSYKVFLVP